MLRISLACLLKAFGIMSQKKSLLLRLDPSLWKRLMHGQLKICEV